MNRDKKQLTIIVVCLGCLLIACVFLFYDNEKALRRDIDIARKSNPSFVKEHLCSFLEGLPPDMVKDVTIRWGSRPGTERITRIEVSDYGLATARDFTIGLPRGSQPAPERRHHRDFILAGTQSGFWASQRLSDE